MIDLIVLLLLLVPLGSCAVHLLTSLYNGANFRQSLLSSLDHLSLNLTALVMLVVVAYFLLSLFGFNGLELLEPRYNI